MAGRGKGARSAAGAAQGRGGRRAPPSSDGPGEAKHEPGAAPEAEQRGGPERESGPPAEEKGAAAGAKKRERHPKAKAKGASGATPRGKSRARGEAVPEGAEKKRERRAKAKAEGAPRGKSREAEGAEEKAAPKEQPGPAPPRRSSLRPLLQTLVLRKAEVSGAALPVNAVSDKLRAAIARGLSLKRLDQLGTGSYYEHLKIDKPDEFDIMFILRKVRVDLEPCDDGECKGAYYFVKLKRNNQFEGLNKFVDGQQRLSASSVISALRTIIISEVKTIDEMKVTVERKKPGSPAVTLQIGEPPSHISVDIILALETCSKTLGSFRKDGPDIKKWLGKNQTDDLDRMTVCLVPKNAKHGKHFRDTWRLSFSLAEKKIIQCHGNTKTCCETNGNKCCRKDCLKLLKYLLEQLRTKHENRNQFNKFYSYHAKTAFFHVCTKWTSDEEWLPTNLDECFERLLDYFLECLNKAELKHFFIPECNLFCADSKCSMLAKVIERERTNGYPIFQQI